MFELGVLETFMYMPIFVCTHVHECKRLGTHLQSLYREAPFTEVPCVTQRKSWYVFVLEKLIEPQEIL